MIVYIIVWGLIFSIILFGWLIAAFQLRKHHQSLLVAALVYGRLFAPVFVISIILRYLILYRLIDKLALLQTTAGQPQVMGQTPYQYLFNILTTQPSIQLYLPNIAQTIGWLSLIFMATLTAMVSFVVVVLYPKSSPYSWSKSLLPDAMKWLLLIGIVSSISFLTDQNGGTFMVTKDIFDLYGMLPVLAFQFFIWSFGEISEEEKRAEKEEEEADSIVSRDIVLDWRRVGAVRAGIPPMFSLGAQKQDDADELSTTVWKAVGGNSIAPNSLDEIRHKLEERIYLNSEQDINQNAWMVNSLPQPTETQFLAAAAVIGILKGLRVLIVIPNYQGDEHPGVDLYQTINAALKNFAGIWQAGQIVLGTDYAKNNLKTCFSNKKLPSCLILQTKELDETLSEFWTMSNPNEHNFHLFSPNIGLVLVSEMDDGNLEELTERIFILKRLAVVLNAKAANYSILATTNAGQWVKVPLSYAFNGISIDEVPFEPKEQSDLKIWLADEGFVEEGIYDWPRRACTKVEAGFAPIYVADFIDLFDRNTINEYRGISQLKRALHVEGDASIVMLDEQSLVRSWRQIKNRTAIYPTGHHSLWYWQASIITRVFHSPAQMEYLERYKMLPYPKPAIGIENRSVVMSHLDKLLFEAGGRLDVETVHELSIIKRYIRSKLRDVPIQQGKYVLRKNRKTGAYRRVSLLETVNFTREDLFGNQVLRKDSAKYQILDKQGGHDTIGAAAKENVKLRYYPGRVFAVGENRFKVRAEGNAYDDKNRVIYVEMCNPQENFLTEPLLSVKVHSMVLRDQSDKVVIQQVREIPNLSIVSATVSLEVEEEIRGYISLEKPPKPITLGQSIKGTYRTRSRVIFFPHLKGSRYSRTAFRHVAELFDRALVAYLNAGDDDIHVCEVGFDDGEKNHPLIKKYGPGILFLDRNPSSGDGDQGGMGVAEALDTHLIENLVRFSRYIMSECPDHCKDGCHHCAPARLFYSVSDIMKQGKDNIVNKQGALRILNP